MFIKSTFNNCIIFNNDFHDNDAHNQEEKDDTEEADDAEPAELVEVQTVPAKEPLAKQSDKNKDYSNSNLVPLLTYPDQANYLIGWMHQNMDNQSKLREKIKIILALDSRGFFKSRVDYEDFVDEFHVTISKSWYSRLINHEYPTTDYDNILESLDMNQFPSPNRKL